MIILNIHISYTTIMINLLHKERSITVFRKTPVHVPNMAMINAVSKLTWRALNDIIHLQLMNS